MSTSDCAVLMQRDSQQKPTSYMSARVLGNWERYSTRERCSMYVLPSVSS